MLLLWHEAIPYNSELWSTGHAFVGFLLLAVGAVCIVLALVGSRSSAAERRPDRYRHRETGKVRPNSHRSKPEPVYLADLADLADLLPQEDKY